jgi:hypothetical protein
MRALGMTVIPRGPRRATRAAREAARMRIGMPA